MKQDNELFDEIDRKTRGLWSSFRRFYSGDSKPFYNKIDRDYKSSGRFPVQVLKAIKGIPRENYDSAVCILRGALPYSTLFEAEGWKVHYLICGRKNGETASNPEELRFNKSVDRTLPEISGKKVLLIDNNCFTGNSPVRTALELEDSYGIKRPDLFLDYLVPNGTFRGDKEKQGQFGNIYIASEIDVKKEEERQRLMKEFLEKLKLEKIKIN